MESSNEENARSVHNGRQEVRDGWSGCCGPNAEIINESVPQISKKLINIPKMGKAGQKEL